jgi:hypothetical protein
MSSTIQSIIELTIYLARVHIIRKKSNSYKAPTIRRNFMGVNNKILRLLVQHEVLISAICHQSYNHSVGGVPKKHYVLIQIQADDAKQNARQ